MINGAPLNLASGMPDTSLGPSPGCPDHVPCTENLCMNGGTCQDLWTYKICICRTGFYGKLYYIN